MADCPRCGNKCGANELSCPACGVQLRASLGRVAPAGQPGVPSHAPATVRLNPGLQASSRQANTSLSSAVTAPSLRTQIIVPQVALVTVPSGKEIPLPNGSGPRIVGRGDPDRNFYPDIDLTNFGASRHVGRKHLRITVNLPTGVTGEDLGSAAQTRVNGRLKVPFQEFPLADGDLIQLGDFVIRIKY